MFKEERDKSKLETLRNVNIHDIQKLMKMKGKSSDANFRMKKLLKINAGAQKRSRIWI